ncbi:MAG TPA: thiamine pyrophosphate-binding protein [Rugosimonospora sp.]|nr:thiamine pyrophosphate-binding protein [Rugosimonospora sp.]
MCSPVRALVEILRSEGVDRIFGNPGTTELPFLDALVDEPDLPYVLGLHEGGVVAMADGYARVTRRPGFASLHIAAGVANGLIGLLNARRSRTPLVVTAGQQDRRHLLHDPMLSGDLVGLARAATKSAVEVQHASDLPLVLRRAFAEAVRPPAGPVFVSIPMDLLAEEVDVAVPMRSARPEVGVAGGLDAAAARLAGAHHPVIIAGDGVGREQAVAELVAVAEALGAAVYHQPMADGINFPGGHPLYHGMPAPTAADLRARLAPHDLVFIVGTHAFSAHHYTPGQPVPGDIDVVQLDSDPAELGRNFPVAIALHGGLRPTLGALAELLAGAVPEAPIRTIRLGQAIAAERARVDALARERYGGAPLDPLAAVHAIASALPADAVVVEEAITGGLLLRQVLRQDWPDSYVHTVGGGLGWGIGAAIGTQLGNPDRPVVAVLGDGSAAFGLQALWTAAHERVPVTFVVLANNEYRTLKDTLDRGKSRSTVEGRYVGLDLSDPCLDWAAAGRAFGVPVAQPGSCAELRELVGDCAALDEPLLVPVPIAAR